MPTQAFDQLCVYICTQVCCAMLAEVLQENVIRYSACASLKDFVTVVINGIYVYMVNKLNVYVVTHYFLSIKDNFCDHYGTMTV